MVVGDANALLSAAPRPLPRARLRRGALPGSSTMTQNFVLGGVCAYHGINLSSTAAAPSAYPASTTYIVGIAFEQLAATDREQRLSRRTRAVRRKGGQLGMPARVARRFDDASQLTFAYGDAVAFASPRRR